MNSDTSTLREVSQATRRIIYKVNDLTFSKKLPRLYAVTDEGQVAVVRCLEHLRDYIACMFGATDYQDLRIEQMKDEFLGRLELLIEEVRVSADREKKIDKSIVADTLRHHGRLFNLAAAEGVVLRSCAQERSDALNLAVAIWGNSL